MGILPRVNLLPKAIRFSKNDGCVASKLTDAEILYRFERMFWSNVDKNGPLWNGTHCWIWTGYISEYGYGRFRRNGRLHRAHKWYWELINGPVPEGKQLDHLCRNKACVNLAHLEPVTHKINSNRGTNPPAVNARKTHCIHGHEFTPENTYCRPNSNWRICRICNKNSRLRSKLRNSNC